MKRHRQKITVGIYRYMLFPQQTGNLHNKKAAPPADTGKAAFDIYLIIRSITTPLHKRSLTV